MYLRHLGLALPAMGLLILSEQVHAASFNIADRETVNTQQKLYKEQSVTVSNADSIIINKKNTDAVQALGPNSSFTNNGNVLTTKDNSKAVFASGPQAAITNNNTIVTNGVRSDGVFSTASNIKIVNTGDISTTGQNAKGVFATGSGPNVKVTNNGTITTAGIDSQGIRSNSQNATIENNGIISTTGDNAAGIHSTGAKTVIFNNKTISTVRSDGITIKGNNSSVENHGEISISGKESSGIDSDGRRTVITNFGKITTNGYDADAVDTDGDGAFIVNKGKIRISGTESDGIETSGFGTTIVNEGTIEASGESSIGIYSKGGSTIIVNQGNIKTSNGTAIAALGDDSIVNQQAGEIQGHIEASGTVNVSGGTISGGISANDVNIDVGAGNQFQSNGIDAQDYNINSGTVNQAGDFNAATTTVNRDATLSFNTSVSGSGELVSNGNLEFVLSSNSLNGSPLLTFEGNVILDEDSNIIISTNTGNLHGQSFNLIDSIDLQTRFASAIPFTPNIHVSTDPTNHIVDNSLLYNFTSDVDPDSQLSIRVEAQDLSLISNNANASAFGAGFTQAVIAGQGGAVADYLAQLGNNDITGFEQAADVFSPSVSGAVTQGSREANEASQRLIIDRLLSSLDNGSRGIWFQGFASKADQDGVDDVEGYQSNTRGFALGYDHQLNSNWGIGAAYSYGEVDADNDRFANDNIDIDSQQLNLYGVYRKNDWYASAILSYADLDYDFQRRNLLPGQSRISGSTDGDLWSAEIAAGKNFQMGAVTVTPTVGLAYSRLSVDKYTEKGGLDLDVDYGQSEELESELAVVFSGQQAYGNWVMTPSARVSWFHEFLDDDASVKAQFAGVNFTQDGADTDADTFGVGLGVNLAHKSGVSLSLDLDSKLNDDYKSHTGSLSLKYDF